MAEEKDVLAVETAYLDRTITFVKKAIEQEWTEWNGKKGALIDFGRDMYENGTHFTEDFDRLTELSQYLSSLAVRSNDYRAASQRLVKLGKQLETPYFARIDFEEEEYGKESIYIGIGTLMDKQSCNTYVYDWRAPVSSMFYRYEAGKAEYTAPGGTVSGEITLKRQYEIKNGKLLYFFDSQTGILDDILRKALSGNASQKMKTIVETIQREQDKIIRDMDNDLVMVQGVAGSGKTSVALHRVAYLMYQSHSGKLGPEHIVLISPNDLFQKYVSNVLPELGEENISTLTFEEIFGAHFGDQINATTHFGDQTKVATHIGDQTKTKVTSRNELLEQLLTAETEEVRERIRSGYAFKLSGTFVKILERYLQYYERRLIPFSDILFNGQIIADRQLLKAELLDKRNHILPLGRRLEQIENRILVKMQEMGKERRKRLERFTAEHTNHPFDTKAFARLLSVSQSAVTTKAIRKFTRLDYFDIYYHLFRDKNLFYRLAAGLELPADIDRILRDTEKALEAWTQTCRKPEKKKRKTDISGEPVKSDESGGHSGAADEKCGGLRLRYEDAMVLLYLKLKMDGCGLSREIRQVVVDEVQDYDPLHIEILGLLYPNARFTMVGDMNQTVEKLADLSLYDRIRAILKKKRTTTILLSKSFRSTHEISSFSARFLEGGRATENFERHGPVPELLGFADREAMEQALAAEISRSMESGCSSVAILCKSSKQAKELHKRIHEAVSVALVDEETEEMPEGTVILPVYLAKGLEYDAAIVYGTDDENYNNPEDRRLLYIACTRALHRLTLVYAGQISRLLEG